MKLADITRLKTGWHCASSKRICLTLIPMGKIVVWLLIGANFPYPQEAVGFIRSTAAVVDHTQINYNPALLQGNQEMVYNAVQSYFEAVI